jgi:hypothetical protein
MSFEEVYSHIPLKQIYAYLPLMLNRITPVMQIYPNRVIGGHSAIVEFHIYIIPFGEKIVKSLKFGENRGNKPSYALNGH